MIRNVLLTGGPTHPFDATSQLICDLFAAHGISTVVETEPRDAITRLRSATHAGAGVDLLTVHALRWSMRQDRYAQLRAEHAFTVDAEDVAVIDAFVRGGGGLLALHTAVICFDAEPTWHALCGASWNWERSSHPPLGSLNVAVTGQGATHTITHDLEPFMIWDEAYGFLDEVPDIEPLLTTNHGGRDHPMLWARSVGEGRVVTDLLGHGTESFAHPVHQTILTRAAHWVAGALEQKPVERTSI